MRRGRAAAIGPLLVLAVAPAAAESQALINVLSYNVQNLFDTAEQGVEYAEFRSGRWDAAR